MATWGTPEPMYTQPTKVDNQNGSQNDRIFDIVEDVVETLNDKLIDTEYELKMERNKTNELRDALARAMAEKEKALADKKVAEKLANERLAKATAKPRTRCTAIEYPAPTKQTYDFGLETVPYVIPSYSEEPEIDEGADEPVNPMECFIVYLESQNVLDLFVQALEENGYTFDDLLQDYPHEYINTSIEMNAGWEEVDKGWQNVVNNLNLDNLEAWL